MKDGRRCRLLITKLKNKTILQHTLYTVIKQTCSHRAQHAFLHFEMSFPSIIRETGLTGYVMCTEEEDRKIYDQVRHCMSRASQLSHL